MENLIKVLVSLLMFLINAHAQYEGPVAPIDSGYGADGNHCVSVISFQSPLWPSRTVDIFYPADISKPVPTVFFSHGYGGNDTTRFRYMLRHVASRGYAIVFSPYKTLFSNNEERYNTLFEGFKKALRDYPGIIDSTRIGFVGHSFGGGATPEMGQRGFVEHGWGEDGRFLYMFAPWYSLEISQSELENFPSDVNMLVELFDDDVINDHRMGIDIFYNIGIPDSSKDCIMLYSDTVSSYPYDADHSVPNDVVFNAYDYYAVYRLIDALMDFTFTGNPEAKNIALGNGSKEQIDMGPFKPLFVTDHPAPQYQQDKYQYPCNSDQNPRKDYCTGFSDVNKYGKKRELGSFLLYQNCPNPFNPKTTIKYHLAKTTHVELSIYNLLGQKIVSLVNEDQSAGLHQVEFMAEAIPSGAYLCELKMNIFRQVRKMVLLK